MIRASFESIKPNDKSSFLVNNFALEKFTAPYHFHPEFELTLITAGTGTRFVGKSIQAYGAGDLVLLGPDLPHCWKSEDIVKGELRSHSVLVQFESTFLGPAFFERPELASISELFRRSACGIRFLGDTVADATGLMKSLSREEDRFRRMIGLLEILEMLANSRQYELLDTDGTMGLSKPGEQERISIALAYVVENFRDKVVLEKVASAVSMSESAFCKYFKRVTGKTFVETVTDYRIHFAREQLLMSERSMTDIAFDSGFGDLSHFYKVFRRRMKISPLQYRKDFLRKLRHSNG